MKNVYILILILLFTQNTHASICKLTMEAIGDTVVKAWSLLPTKRHAIHPNGTKQYQGRVKIIKRGKIKTEVPIGTWYEYDENGTLVRKLVFSDGKDGKTTAGFLLEDTNFKPDGTEITITRRHIDHRPSTFTSGKLTLQEGLEITITTSNPAKQTRTSTINPENLRRERQIFDLIPTNTPPLLAD